MVYKLKEICFDPNMQYNLIDYWRLYKIYDALTFCKNNDEYNNFYYSNCLTGNYGHFYFDKIDERANTFSEDYFQSLNNSKQFSEVQIELIKNYIPENILKEVADIRVFCLGVMTQDIYTKINKFECELKQWLTSPTGTTKTFDLELMNTKGEEKYSWYFHDVIYSISKTNENLKMIEEQNDYSKEYLLFKNCKTIVLNYLNEIIHNDYIESIDYAYRKIQGYQEYILKRTDTDKFEINLEMNNKNISEIIIETDDFDHLFI